MRPTAVARTGPPTPVPKALADQTTRISRLVSLAQRRLGDDLGWAGT
jgi:hypothetical protein